MMKAGTIYRESISKFLKDNVQNRSSVFVISYTKVSSLQMDTLRKTLKKVGAKVYVSKNSVAQRTLKDLQFEPLAQKISGQTAFVLSDVDSVEISKALTKFSKECGGVLIQGGLLQGKVLNVSDVKRLSNLPSREALLSQLLGVIQSPLVGFMSALNNKTQDLLSVLKQLSEQKEKGGK